MLLPLTCGPARRKILSPPAVSGRCLHPPNPPGRQGSGAWVVQSQGLSPLGVTVQGRGRGWGSGGTDGEYVTLSLLNNISDRLLSLIYE